jgi:hypothetical protein
MDRFSEELIESLIQCSKTSARGRNPAHSPLKRFVVGMQRWSARPE